MKSDSEVRAAAILVAAEFVKAQMMFAEMKAKKSSTEPELRLLCSEYASHVSFVAAKIVRAVDKA